LDRRIINSSHPLLKVRRGIGERLVKFYFTVTLNPSPETTFLRNPRVGLVLPDSKRAKADCLTPILSANSL
jgi:hypothetical protein